MWLMTKTGFFSVVRSHDTEETVMVRGRSRADIQRLIDGYCLQDVIADTGGLMHTPNRDYPYKIKVPHKVLADIIHDEILEIDYGNFKSMVTKALGHQRHDTYMRVWSALHAITSEPDAKEPHKPLKEVGAKAMELDLDAVIEEAERLNLRSSNAAKHSLPPRDELGRFVSKGKIPPSMPASGRQEPGRSAFRYTSLQGKCPECLFVQGQHRYGCSRGRA